VKIEERRDDDFERFWSPVATEVGAASSLEGAAQAFCERFYAEFAESAVLVRAFVTLPFAALGQSERDVARTFAERAGHGALLGDATPVLTLLGTYGIEPRWRRRSESRGHLAIPLLSEELVGEIPMIARLLGEIGFPELRPGRDDWQFVKRVGGGDGLFFVGDARTTTDERGRLIIPATEFVDRYGVRSVFGFGGPYEGATFLSVIVFCRQAILRSSAIRFVPLIEKLRVATQGLLRDGALFAD
jgi:hypothetical protein